MTVAVQGQNCAQAWARGVVALKAHGPISPLVTEITEPTAIEDKWWRELSPRTIVPGSETLHSVVEMVGPDELIINGLARAEIYQRAWRKFDRCRSRGLHLSNWRDTYFERLTRIPEGANRLETIILKMKKWPGRRVAAFYAHTTSNSMDNVVPLGNPCLQYIQFVQREHNKVDLVSLYRNHDFAQKALGNFIGLGRLLAFVARETNQTAGALTCFSVNAYLDQQRLVCPVAQSILN